ncbi:MAG: DUF58 domain-containing protein [Saprospirales bacterium]|nr:DUF58 domain-containing protein [Saprospirales bacterium]
MWQIIRNSYLPNRFFLLFGGVVALCALGFPFPVFFYVGQAAFMVALALVLADALLLFNRRVDLNVKRRLPKVLSLGDPNPVRLELHNRSPYKLQLSLIDELRVEFQIRDFAVELQMEPGSMQELTYDLTPNKRGAYSFGAIQLFVSSPLGLVQRRITIPQTVSVPVYPSILQMKKYALKAFDKVTSLQGIKKIRRIGHSYEFEQIKEYVRGDDYRSVNWKATSRKAGLMVNQYEDERAQQVYCLIDKSRVMRLPFNGLSLMDYAINTSLVMSNIALQKHDKAGLLTFSDKIGSILKADRKGDQMNKILMTLYNEKERPVEANYELTYQAVRRLIKGRSLLLLFTNFESMFALERVLPVLRRINLQHLLVVIFFENTEIQDFAYQEVTDLEAIYTQTMAQKFVAEKRQLVQKLRQFGIQAILTRPEELSVHTINKYLELKARGLI